MGAIEEEVSTVFVGGLPTDATPRELDNLCRFLPGYTNSKVDTRKGTTLFARFDSQQSALDAITMLNNQIFDRSMPGEPMRVVLAKSNMRSDRPSGPPWGYNGQAATVPPPVTYASAGGPAAYTGGGGAYTGNAAPGGPSGKRPRIPENPSQVDTVASVGAAEAGIDEATLQSFFASLPGFVTFKPNPRMGGGFAKFSSAGLAAQAVAQAESQGVPAAIAKSSMGGPTTPPPPPGSPPPPPPRTAPEPYAAYPRAGAWNEAPGQGPKRPRIPEDPSQVDTVACVGAADQGIDEATLQGFFAGLAGYVAFKPNPRMGGGFAKFQSVDLALAAISQAEQQGIPAAMAKSSMSAP